MELNIKACIKKSGHHGVHVFIVYLSCIVKIVGDQKDSKQSQIRRLLTLKDTLLDLTPWMDPFDKTKD